MGPSPGPGLSRLLGQARQTLWSKPLPLHLLIEASLQVGIQGSSHSPHFLLNNRDPWREVKGPPHNHTAKIPHLLTQRRALPPHHPPHQYTRPRIPASQTRAKNGSSQKETLASPGHIWDTTTVPSLPVLSAWGLEKSALRSSWGLMCQEIPGQDRRCPATPQCLPGHAGQPQPSSPVGLPKSSCFCCGPVPAYFPPRTHRCHQEHSVHAGFSQPHGLQCPLLPVCLESANCPLGTWLSGPSSRCSSGAGSASFPHSHGALNEPL